MTLSEATAKVLRTLRDGAELVMHTRQTGRGPYYTLAGRRLSVVTLKELEGQKLVAREGRGGSPKTAYVLTEAGRSALEEWEHSRSRED